jgi:acyl carrier protein
MSVDFEEVRKIISRQLNIPPERITEDALFNDDLRADSIDTIDLVMVFESIYGIEITEEESEKMHRVSDLVEYLNEKTG